MDASLKPFQDWFESRQDRILKDFFTFLSFPSIGTDPAYKIQTRQTAEWVSTFLKSAGLDTVELWETSGFPVVFSSHLKGGKEAPTLLIYHHYDIQPVDPLELWDSDPFKPVIKEGQIYARGALDNKGQCFYSLNAIKAFLELAKDCHFNLKIFIEGEEESGSAGTFAILNQKREALQADYLLIVDTDLPAPGIPGISLGVRGITTLEVECCNSFTDLHSGTHGGIALNPNYILASALARLRDENGRVAVPGFYDSVLTVSKEELASVDQTFDTEQYVKDFGIKAFAAEKGISLIEANWFKPTLEINGMWGGYIGSGFKTVIPAKAHAKISCRLVPDQDPQDIAKKVGDFLQQLMPKGVSLQTQFYPGGSKAYRSPYPSEIASITARAFEAVFEKPCKRLLCGATIPIVGALAEASGADAVMIGLGLSTDQIHAPNEHFGFDRFEQGFLTIAKILLELNRPLA